MINLSLQIETVQLMHPQDRNLHGKVFGGILMRLVRLRLAFLLIMLLTIIRRHCEFP